VIVRERPDSFVLFEQHDHALASGEFARRWAGEVRPRAATVRAVESHDVAWRVPDARVRWNEEAGRPYSFVDYPVVPKLRAYAAGIDLLEFWEPYAACLCSMHYETLTRAFGRGSEEEAGFVEAEVRRQGRLREGMAAEERENLKRNLDFLRLCDGLSLFVCLNEPGAAGRPPPYPGGFEFDGQGFEPAWEDEATLRLDPNPFAEPFGLSVPYTVFGRDREPHGDGRLELRVTC
jgi:hypothetical protein